MLKKAWNRGKVIKNKLLLLIGLSLFISMAHSTEAEIQATLEKPQLIVTETITQSATVAPQAKSITEKPKIVKPTTTKQAQLKKEVSPEVKRTNYLSFNFQDVDLRTLLQIIAKNSGKNFVISDAVKGNMSLSLKEVTWEKALSVVLRANGLDSRTEDNVIIIAPVEELAANDVKRLQAQQQLSSLSPPVSDIIHLRYANANDLVNVLKGQGNTLLSANGQIGADTRTNAIWVRDTEENLGKIKKFVNQLDITAQQVLIEARIVSIDTDYAEELGIRWGISNSKNLSGTLEGANELRKGTSLANTPLSERLNFNIPATTDVFGATPASMGLALLHINKSYLDLELSALEGEQHGEIISNPRVITSNLQKALIQTGEEIPYQEATSSGATNVSFKKAVLSLEIVPQITSDKNIILNLKVTQNKRGTNTQTGEGAPQVPAIDTQEVQSSVQLKDGETIVIGGVYKQTQNNNVERIPFLGSLPIVGGLFRHTHKDVSRSELLLFVTPKIITQANIAQLTSKEERFNKLSLDLNRDLGTKKEAEGNNKDGNKV